VTEDPQVSYRNFAAWRKETDNIRINNKKERENIANTIGYSAKEMYLVHHTISYLLQGRNTEKIVSITPDFFSHLINISKDYTIETKKIISLFIKKHKQEPIKKKKKKPHKEKPTAPPRIPSQEILYQH
jgi:hypothetical protein